MGILNVTPDSFSEGGLYDDADRALQRAKEMLAEGADVIDVGGESTRPDATPVDPDEELNRVVPVIERITGELTGGSRSEARVSVDTRREEVARAAVAAGATIINDVSAELWPVAAELDVGWIAMHTRGEPTTSQHDPHYDDVVDEVGRFLDARATQASEGGVGELWIDPGFGFGKSVHHDVTLLANMERLLAFGWPVVMGTSRKPGWAQLLARSDQLEAETAPIDDRLIGSVVTSTYAMMCGVGMIRVHDVKASKQAANVVAGGHRSKE